MSREAHVRFCEGLGVQLPRPTHPYIPTDEGWLYLAVVIDLFSRQVVGWSMRADMTRDLVIDALRMAWFKRHPAKDAGLIFHSDSNNAVAKFPGRLDSHSDRPVIDLVRWDFRSS